MLEYSEDLRKAHFIKELFVDILDENSKIMLFTANINADNHCCFFYLLNLLILCRIHLQIPSLFCSFTNWLVSNDSLTQVSIFVKSFTFYTLNYTGSYSKQRTLFSEWLREVENSGIEEFKAAITAFRNNYKYILNSLKYRHILQKD